MERLVRATGPAADAIHAHVPRLVEERFASRLFASDPTLWGPEAEAEAAKRLAWVDLPEESKALIPQIAALHDQFATRGIDRVVLCGMGGSSLAPEVICANADRPIDILDSSHPDMVRAYVRDLDRTVVVVSSKSGSTVETDSQKRIFEAAFVAAGLSPTAHIVIVTDPGSPLDEAARKDGYTVINANPDVGGRYSALSAFGLVPAGLAGVDISRLLDDAEQIRPQLAADSPDNPALRLGAAIAGTSPLRDKLYLPGPECELIGFSDWAEQLIAESTGKQGKGILPVPLPTQASFPLAQDVTLTRIPDGEQEFGISSVTVDSTLGAQFLLWEAAVAVAGALLGIDPFDQPDVESAKAAARELLDKGVGTAATPDFTDAEIDVFGNGGSWLGSASTAAEAVQNLLGELAPHGYISIQAYLPRDPKSVLRHAAQPIVTKTRRPATFGWGPRFLHSTGQFHKGGPQNGVFIQITDDPIEDLAIPGREFTLGQFIAAQAAGDAQVLVDHGRPVLRLHLKNPEQIKPLMDALTEMPYMDWTAIP